MYSRVHEKDKRTLELTQSQHEILVGSLLGDGHLETYNRRSYRLKIEHGLAQRDYVEWLYHQFADWTGQQPTRKYRGGVPASWWFTTYRYQGLKYYGDQFYRNGGVKRIPPDIDYLLNPQALAVWFMDDGSRKSARHKTLIIHTLGYTYADLVRLGNVLKHVYDVNIELHKQRQKYWRIYIPSSSVDTFRSLIEPYIIPTLRYKLG